MVISIKGLRKAFLDRRSRREVCALDGIDLEVADGELLCIVGPSGCGKSTLLNILAGFEQPTEGAALVEGPEGDRRPPAVVFQEHALFPWRTVIDNVAFGPEMRGVARRARHDAARRYLELVGLTGFETLYPHQLSGGMRQRVGLARALATEPSVLLMDEPFASLDAQTKFILQQELLRIWELTGKTIVYITHAIDEAVYMGERVVVMTRRPGRVKAVVHVDLGRARGERELSGFREQVWDLLKEEIPRL